MLVIARNPVTVELKRLLNSTPPLVVSSPPAGFERFAISRAPEVIPRNQQGELIHGYGIIYPRDSPTFWGSLGSPEDCLTAVYQITVVGRNDDHVSKIADAVRKVIVGRTSGGQFTNAMTPTGHAIIGRRSSSTGLPEPMSGGIWQQVDLYDLEVQAINV